MGRPRAGLTTKIQTLVDASGVPVMLKRTTGKSATDMLNGLSEGQILLAVRAYDSNALRETMDKRSARACIRPSRPARLQPIPLLLSQPRRALLQQAQTLPCRCHALRKPA